MPDHQIGLTVSNRILDRFKSLLYLPSPSSREQAIAAEIESQVAAMDLTPQRDAGGNVWVELEGEDPSLPLWLYAAHMDEIGLVVTKVREDGNLEVARNGGLYPWKLGETPVEVLGDGETVLGVLSMGSLHLPQEQRKPVEWEATWIETGLTKEQVLARGVRPGSSAVPHAAVRGPIVFGDPDDPMAGSWTFDDRLGCAILLELLTGSGRFRCQASAQYGHCIRAQRGDRRLRCQEPDAQAGSPKRSLQSTALRYRPMPRSWSTISPLPGARMPLGTLITHS